MRLPLASALCLASVALAAPAHAADWGDDVQVIDDASMDDLRGGFEVNGITIGFGATISTYADGVLALTTQLTWTDAGAIVDQTLGNLGQTIDSLTPQQRAAMGLDGVTGGVVISDESGITALVHNVTDSALQNIILNTASGRNLSQEVDVTLTLPGFEAIQQDLGNQLLGIRLNDDLSHMMSSNTGG